MILAITERFESRSELEPFTNRYYLTEFYKKISDQLDILLFPIISDNNLDKVIEICDGLIITGSPIDINPKYYNEEINDAGNYVVDEFKLDKKLIELFYSKNKPILGICGGLQSINVAFGGTLKQNVLNHDLIDSTHNIKLFSDTFLNKVYKDNNLLVNSYHHQAIKDVAPGFKVSAVSDDGIIEAIEKDNIVGVQWHPEVINDINFFKSFIDKFIIL